MPAGGLGGEAAETVAQERAALGSIHALLGALERRQRDAAAAAEAQQVWTASPVPAVILGILARSSPMFLQIMHLLAYVQN